MKKHLSILILAFSLWQGGAAQTLGETLQDVSDGAQHLASTQQTGQTWGIKTAVDDLLHLAAEASRLQAALSTPDAREVEELERSFTSAAYKLKTSKVMLPDNYQPAADQLIGQAELVARRLSQLRLRFGSRASSVSGSLVDSSLALDENLGYTNINDLLIDVRTARELVSTLRTGTVPQFNLTLSGGAPNNLDGLQVRRLQLAAWDLERQLSGDIGDIRDTVETWEKFEREYRRLAYPGAGSNIRQLERVMERLRVFYSELAGSSESS